MKIGTSTKIAIGVIIAIIAGGIGFQVWIHQKTQQSDVKPDDKQKEEKERKIDVEAVGKQVKKGKKFIKNEQYSKEEIEEFLAWLNSLEEKESAPEKSQNKELIRKQKRLQRRNLTKKNLIQHSLEAGQIHQKIEHY